MAKYHLCKACIYYNHDDNRHPIGKGDCTNEQSVYKYNDISETWKACRTWFKKKGTK